MVKFIRSLFVLAMVAALTGCFGAEYHLYTRSISKSDSWDIKEIPKELFNGTYERISSNDGSKQGSVTINTVKCGRFDLVADIDPKADCRASDDSDVIKMNSIVRVGRRLFVETIVKTGMLSKRLALFEIVVTKDKFVLTQMVFDKAKLMETNLEFSRSEHGDNTHYEVQNKAGQTMLMINAMTHGDRYKEIHFRPESEELNQKLRKILSDVAVKEQELSCEQEATAFARVEGARRQGGLHHVL